MNSENWSHEDRRARASGPGNRKKDPAYKGPRGEAHAATETKDSSFGKSYPARPTADEVVNNVDGAGNVPFESLPEATQRELERRGVRDPRVEQD